MPPLRALPQALRLPALGKDGGTDASPGLCFLESSSLDGEGRRDERRKTARLELDI